MNKNIKQLLHENFNVFLKLVKLGVIDKETGMKAVINSKSPYFIYEFAINVEDVNIEKLTDAIIETPSVVYIYRFAFDIKGANLKKIEQGIIETQDIQWIYYFARDIKGANKGLLLAEIEKIEKKQEIIENNKEISRTLKRTKKENKKF